MKAFKIQPAASTRPPVLMRSKKTQPATKIRPTARKVRELEAAIARQQKEIEALAASLKEQTLQIKKERAASLR